MFLKKDINLVICILCFTSLVGVTFFLALCGVFIAIFFLLGNESNPVAVRAKLSHAAIPQEDIVWLYDYMNAEGKEIPFESAIHIMKRKLFPFHYDPSPWVPGDNFESIFYNNYI